MKNRLILSQMSNLLYKIYFRDVDKISFHAMETIQDKKNIMHLTEIQSTYQI